jgi:hypothetical protein
MEMVSLEKLLYKETRLSENHYSRAVYHKGPQNLFCSNSQSVVVETEPCVRYVLNIESVIERYGQILARVPHTPKQVSISTCVRTHLIR